MKMGKSTLNKRDIEFCVEPDYDFLWEKFLLKIAHINLSKGKKDGTNLYPTTKIQMRILAIVFSIWH